MYRVRLSDIQIYFISSHTHENTVIVYYTVMYTPLTGLQTQSTDFKTLKSVSPPLRISQCCSFTFLDSEHRQANNLTNLNICQCRRYVFIAATTLPSFHINYSMLPPQRVFLISVYLLITHYPLVRMLRVPLTQPLSHFDCQEPACFAFKNANTLHLACTVSSGNKSSSHYECSKTLGTGQLPITSRLCYSASPCPRTGQEGTRRSEMAANHKNDQPRNI